MENFQDLIDTLDRCGEAAQKAGFALEELTQLILKVYRITGRSSEIIGNSLKTILTRLEREDGIKTLQTMGVEGENGKQRLFRLAAVYNDLTDVQKTIAGEVLGGIFQINIFKALMV